MQEKYHIALDGTIKPCKAKSQCPLGGEYNHFTDLNQAQKQADYVNRIEYELENLSVKEIKDKISEFEANDPTNKESDYYRNALVNGQRYKTEPSNINLKDISKMSEEPDFGFTVDINNGIIPTNGFCYSPYPQHSVVISEDEDTANAILEYQENNKDLLNKNNHYIGLWRSPYDNNLYLDISVVTLDAREAREECLKHDQQAFFDLQTFTSAEVDKEATSGQKD